MADQALFYWNDKFGKTQPRYLTLVWQITGAKTVSTVPMGTPVLTTFDAIAAQATIDNFLGTTSEFTIAQFDATSMGTDAFGCIVNMSGNTAAGTGNGQMQTGVGLEVSVYNGASLAALTTEVRRATLSTTLTASTLETAMQVGANGNVAFKVNFGNSFDGFTVGFIIARLYWISK